MKIEGLDRINPVFLEVLDVILARLAGQGVDWALTGSLGHALQGVPVWPRDIDLQADEAGAHAIMDCFPEFVHQPIAYLVSADIRSHFGIMHIDGVKVDVMGAVEKRLSDGTWTPPPDLSRHRRFVMVAGRHLPVLDLAYEADAYELLGRHERAALIRRVLQKSNLG